MINTKSLQIERLRRICEDPTMTPGMRRTKTLELLAKFKPTKNTVKPIVLNVIRSLEHFQDASLERQKEVRAMAEEIERALKAKIKACEAEELEDEEADVPAPTTTPLTPEPDPVPEPVKHEMFTGLDLLEPEAQDEVTHNDLSKHFDWHGLDGRTDLNWVRGKDFKTGSEINDPKWGFLSEGNLPHSNMIARLDEAFDPILPVIRADDWKTRQSRTDMLWYHAWTIDEIDRAEAALKVGPWLQIKRTPDGQPTIELTELGQRKRFLEFVRARVQNKFTSFGKAVVDISCL